MKFSTNLQKLAEHIDVGPLLAKLEANPHLWEIDTRRQRAPGSAHHDTECIVLRGPSDPTLATFATDVGAAVTELMAMFEHELHPVLDQILNRIEATEVGRMLFAKLKPDGRIDWHADEGLYAKAWARFHIVLTSDEGNRFMVEDESVHMRPGECWWFAHRRAHGVVNHSGTPRIHLIVDFKSDRFPVERQGQP
jgi:hypothetical protein